MHNRSLWASIAVLVMLAPMHGALAASAPRAQSLMTIAEQSRFQRTGRYEEVERLCPEFQRHYSTQVRCLEFGRTPEGRPMLALIASADGTVEPATARQKQRPVVFIQGGIHAGEIDGKDAGLLALREMLEGRVATGVLERVTFVFVPVFSVDGHERFGRWNRPNQVGPEESGWRTTAQNLNLNRDYTKAEAPEMQALLRLLNAWDPLLYVDLHVTDGADFEHDVSFSVTPTLAGDVQLMSFGNELRADLLLRMQALGSLPLDFYPQFVRDDDPRSGFAVSVSQTRFSQQYWAERNRFGILVETHSWKDYRTRVRVTRNSIITLLELVARRGPQWLEAVRAADERAGMLGGTTVALTYENTEHVRTIEFRGYEYLREASAISGALVTRYDNKRPQLWRVPLRDEVRPAISVEAPRGGYLIPAAHAAWLGEKLALHGIESRRLDRAVADAEVQIFRAVAVKPAPATYEGRTVVQVEGNWEGARRPITAGMLFVPIAQPKARLLLTLLEPRSRDSFVSWGFFNAAFERKEYMEAYVAEQVGVEMLKDPLVKQEFERLLDDPAFARDPAARLDFFYQRHPSWDDRLNLYPVYRIDQPL